MKASAKLGGFHAGDITDVPPNQIGPRRTLAGTFPSAGMNAYAGGRLVDSLDRVYPIVSSVSGVPASLVIELPNGQEEPATGACTIYEDDYVARDDILRPGSTRVDVAADSSMYHYLQPKATTDWNKFADAYIEPQLTALDAYDNEVAALTNSQPSDFENARGSTTLEDDVFWVAYLSSAFEPLREEDGDVGGEAAPWAAGLTPTLKNEISLVYFETTFDKFRPDWPFGNALGIVAAHELVHQFMSPPFAPATDAVGHYDPPSYPFNLMYTGKGYNDPANRARGPDSVRLFPDSVATLRGKLHSPGTPG